MEQLISLKEAAKRLRLSTSLLWRLAIKGKISYMRINRRIFFSEAQLQDFIKACTIERT